MGFKRTLKRDKRKFNKMLKTAVIDENPTFVTFLALCPTLGVTNNVANAIGMGISVIFVLAMSNVLVSSISRWVPDEIRIPVYITIIATLVTVLEMVMETYMPNLYTSLGIFLPLIVVNCIILGRAESFASQNKVKDSLFDGITVGIAFSLSLILLATFREILGTGGIAMLNIQIFSSENSMELFVQSTGAFLAFGILAWIISDLRMKQAKKAKKRRA